MTNHRTPRARRGVTSRRKKRAQRNHEHKRRRRDLADRNVEVFDDKPKPLTAEESTPDWSTPCICCEAVPTLPYTEMCGPCTFGEAATAGGNW